MPKLYRLNKALDPFPIYTVLGRLINNSDGPEVPTVPGDLAALQARSVEFGIPAGYPRFETVGVPVGTTLTVMNQDYNITTDTVLEDLEIHGTVKANKCNVILRRCKIIDTASMKLTTSNGGTLLAEDCEIDGAGGGGAIGVGHDNITLKRCYVHHCVDGIRPTNNCLIENCLVVDSVDNENKNHVDCLQFTGGLNVTVRGNTFLSWRQVKDGRAAWGNAAIGIGCETNRLKDVLIEGNYLSGGNTPMFVKNPTRWYNTIGSSDTTGTQVPGPEGIRFDMENVVIRNNEFRGDFRTEPSSFADITIRESMRSTTAAISPDGANNLRFYGNFSTPPANRNRPTTGLYKEGIWRDGALRVQWQSDLGSKSGVLTLEPNAIGLGTA